MKLFFFSTFSTLLASTQANFFRRHRGRNGFLGAGQHHKGNNFHTVLSLANQADFNTLNISFFNCDVDNLAHCMAHGSPVEKTNIGSTASCDHNGGTCAAGDVKWSLDTTTVQGLNLYNVEYIPSSNQNHIAIEIETSGQQVLEESFICAAGQYVKNDGTCAPCAAGESAASGAATCTPCAPGTYQDSTQGETSCKTCAPGSYTGTTAGGATSCTICPIGTYSTQSDVTACSICPAGTYGATTGLTTNACSGDCAAGKNGELPPQATVGFTTNTCGGDCPQGTYSTAGAPHCILCAAGTYGATPGLTTDSCTDHCQAGYYGAEEGQTIATCTSNCNAGYDGSVNSGNGHTDANCAGICAAGEWSDGSTACQDCGAGKYGTGGSTDSACSGNCAAGKDGSQTQQTTAACNGDCQAGKYSESGDVQCTDCGAGKYGTGGSTDSACTGNCAAGKDGSQTQQTTAACNGDCAAGKYSLSGAVQCTDCAAGKYGTGGSTDNNCDGQCTAGYDGSQTGQTAHTCNNRCPDGKWSDGTASGCTDCAAGKYGSVGAVLGTIACSGECQLGDYQDVAGSTSCKTCAPGSITATTGTGATSCTLCANPNTYSDISQLLTCKDCADGKFSPGSGATACTPCGAGTAGQGTAAGCGECVANQQNGALYTDTTGTTSIQGCSTCDPGSLLGTAQVTVNGATVNVGTSCTECQDDNYSNDPFDTTCTACAAGKVAQCAAGCTVSTDCTFRSHMYGYVSVPDATNTACTSGCQCEDKCISWRGDLKDGFTIVERTSEFIIPLDDSANGVDKPLCDLLKKTGRLIKQQGC